MPTKEKDREKVPGRYYIEVEGFDGFIQFPHPLTLPQFRDWWALAVEPLGKSTSMNPLKWEAWDAQWSGFKMLLLDWGKWEIAGESCSVGDVKGDTLPNAVAEFVLTSGRLFILEDLDPKKKQILLTII